jgi:hypothetical protein
MKDTIDGINERAWERAMSKPEQPRHQPFDVYLHGKCIDTVFYSASAKVDTDEVRRSLIDHDGYDPAIVVKARRQGR